MKRDEFATLVLASTDSLYRVAKDILHQDSECEDAVWEAVTTAFEKLDTLRQDQYAKTWLIRILIHECYRILRRQKKLAPSENALLNVSDEPADYSELYEAIYSLKDKYKIPVILFYIEGFSVTEIARITDTSEGNVKNRLHSFLKSLGVNQPAAERLVETEPSVTYGSDTGSDQIIDIQESYCDGGKLVLVATAADGSGDTYESKDHAYVNGADCMVTSYENPENSAEMIYEINLQAIQGLRQKMILTFHCRCAFT